MSRQQRAGAVDHRGQFGEGGKQLFRERQGRLQDLDGPASPCAAKFPAIRPLSSLRPSVHSTSSSLRGLFVTIEPLLIMGGGKREAAGGLVPTASGGGHAPCPAGTAGEGPVSPAVTPNMRLTRAISSGETSFGGTPLRAPLVVRAPRRTAGAAGRPQSIFLFPRLTQRPFNPLRVYKLTAG